jgi:hypothetical protein
MREYRNIFTVTGLILLISFTLAEVSPVLTGWEAK